MANRRSQNWLNQQRVDVPHLRSIESAVRNDFDELLSSFAIGENASYFIRGFELNMVGAVGSAASSLQLIVDEASLFHGKSNVSGTFFQVESGTPNETLNSTTNTKVDGAFTPSSLNYVGLELKREVDSNTISQLFFWNPTNKTEFSKTTPLAQILDYEVVITGTTWAANVLPLAIVQTDSSNAVLSVEDRRPMLFRLGTAGNTTPDPAYEYQWNNHAEGRAENPFASSSATSPFRGGDKQIKHFKEWADAVMSQIKELKGTTYWYSFNQGGSILKLRGDVANTQVTGSGLITHSDATGGLLTWNDDFHLTFISSRIKYTISANDTPSTNLQLNDNDVAYINIVRGQEITPSLIFTQSSAIVTSVGGVAWTGDVQAGDYIKRADSDDTKYYEIATVDSTSQVTLTGNYLEASTGSLGTAAEYAFGTYDTVAVPSTNRHVQVAQRELVPFNEDAYWIFLRDDNGGTAKVYIRGSGGGELEQGESRQISDNTTEEVLNYIGSQGEADDMPDYTNAVIQGIAEVTTYTFPAAAALATGQYFNFKAASDLIDYHAYPIIDGTGTAPSVIGSIPVSFAINTGDSAIQVAASFHAVVNALADFSSVDNANGTVTVTNTDVGATTDAANVDMGAGFSIAVDVQGQGSANFSLIDTENLTRGIKRLDSAIAQNSADIAADTWKAPVPNFAALPATGNRQGDVRLILETGVGYRYDATQDLWLPFTGVGTPKLIGGGTISHDVLGSVSFSQNMFLEKSGLTYADNTIPTSESPIVLPNDKDVAYVEPNLISQPGGAPGPASIQQLDDSAVVAELTPGEYAYQTFTADADYSDVASITIGVTRVTASVPPPSNANLEIVSVVAGVPTNTVLFTSTNTHNMGLRPVAPAPADNLIFSFTGVTLTAGTQYAWRVVNPLGGFNLNIHGLNGTNPLANGKAYYSTTGAALPASTLQQKSDPAGLSNTSISGAAYKLGVNYIPADASPIDSFNIHLRKSGSPVCDFRAVIVESIMGVTYTEPDMSNVLATSTNVVAAASIGTGFVDLVTFNFASYVPTPATEVWLIIEPINITTLDGGNSVAHWYGTVAADNPTLRNATTQTGGGLGAWGGIGAGGSIDFNHTILSDGAPGGAVITDSGVENSDYYTDLQGTATTLTGPLSIIIDDLENVPPTAAIIARRDGDDIIVGTSSTRLALGESMKLYDSKTDQDKDKMRGADYGYFRSDEPVVWTGTQLEFTQDIVFEALNRNGIVQEYTVLAANSPISLADGNSLYLTIDRTNNAETLTFTNSATIPALPPAGSDVVMFAKRRDVAGEAYLHLPLHKQVLEPGQSVRLGASGSGAGTVKATYLDPTSTTLPTGATVTIDGQAGVDGDTVLFTNLVADNNRIYELSGVGVAVAWEAIRAFDGEFDSTSGDEVRIQSGDAFGSQKAVHNGTNFLVNDIIRLFDGVSGNFWELSSIKNSTLTDATTDSVFEVNVVGSENWIIDYSLIRGISKETGTLVITSDGTSAEIAKIGANLGPANGVEFTVDVVGADLRLRYTTTATGDDVDLKYSYKRWSNSIGGPTGVPNYTNASTSTIAAAGAITGAVQYRGVSGNLDADSKFVWDAANSQLNLNGMKITALSAPVTLLDAQAGPVTAVTLDATTDRFFTVKYSIKRGLQYRNGTLTIATDGSAATGFGDEFSETASTGIVLTATTVGTNLNIQYTSTAAGADADFKYTIIKWN